MTVTQQVPTPNQAPTFPQHVEALELAMMTAHTAVSSEKNPVLLGAPTASYSQLIAAAIQYTYFPAQIVACLRNARDRAAAAGWNEVAAELDRNIGEEEGSQSNQVSHYELLCRGMLEEFGIDPRQTPLREATKQFLHTMQELTSHADPAFAIGAAYACESSAVPELRIVRSLFRVMAIHQGRTDIAPDGILEDFMRRHLDDWEPGHRAGLNNTCSKYITTAETLQRFADGFEAVMRTMDAWWAELKVEAAKS